MPKIFFQNKAGFTLLELMIAIAVIAVLSVGVYLAVKPAKRIVDAKNAVRVQDVKAIEQAIKSALLSSTTSPSALTNIAEDTYYVLINSGSVSDYSCTELNTTTDGLDISEILKPYLGGEMPLDPDASGANTEYYLVRRGNLFDVGYCNWSREAICGDGYCIEGESCSSCEADCGSCITNSPPIVSDAGRVPTDEYVGEAIFILSWSAWTDPDEDIVEYYVEYFRDSNDCGVLDPAYATYNSGWITATNKSYSARPSMWHSWHVRARSQGESDETAYNTCYSFYILGF